MAVLWFLAGLLVGSAIVLSKREESTPQYQPTRVEQEIAKYLEPEELTGAYLYKGEGLAGYEVSEGRLN